MNWKLLVIIFAALILLVVCYILLMNPSLYKDKFSGGGGGGGDSIDTNVLNVPHEIPNDTSRKFKINISNEEEFKTIAEKIKVLEGSTFYYFPEVCPSYRSEYYLIDKNDKMLERYYLPEEKHLIIVGPDHKWTKPPDFVHWKYT